MSDEQKMPGRRRLGLLAVAFLGIALAIIAWAVRLAEDKARDAAAAKEVQQRLAVIRQSGQPTSFQELAARYPDPPPEHDAELLLKPAVTALIEPNGSESLPYFGGDWPPTDAPLSPQFIAALRAAMERNSNALAVFPRDELESAWVGCGFANGFTNQPKTSLHGIGSLARVLCLNAVLQSSVGDSSAAAKSLEKALLISRIFKNDTVLHGLMEEFLRERACESLNQILNRAEMSEADLKDLSGFLPMTDNGFVKELFINERAFGVSEAEQIKSMVNQAASRHSSVGRMIYQDQDLLEYLDRAQTNLTLMDLPMSNAIPKLVELEKRQKEDDDRNKAVRTGLLRKFLSPRISFLSIITPPLASHLLVEETKNFAYERATLTAIAIERYALSHAGRRPENLSALVPEYLASVPKDPFDDHDLRFKKLERGYVIYSVGPDFTDDNGEPEPKEASNPLHYDIIFSVKR